MYNHNANQPGPPFDARAVANFLLDLASADQIPITQLQLYKIVYFCHGWYLAEHNRPLVWNIFEVWKHGPVIKVLRDNFEKFGSDPISVKATEFDYEKGQYFVSEASFSKEIVNHITAIYRIYAHISGLQLSLMTHEAGGAWDRIWNSRVPSGRFAMRIREHEILEDFIKLRAETKFDNLGAKLIRR
ncbi:MAG TPA: hypothetical protein DCL54_04600 [Alphaproteobacteria bacterium]|nr:hypothetical protein [Alphaproteobacteria bacterium]HAJ45844.1 hypothetical protein [Alphaproteobacteria bacterium]